MDSHKTTECPCFCQHCGITATREVIAQQHKEKYYEYPQSCPNKCGWYNIPQCDMSDQECPLEIIQCPLCRVMVARKDEKQHNKELDVEHEMIICDRIQNIYNDAKQVKYLDSGNDQSTCSYCKMFGRIFNLTTEVCFIFVTLLVSYLHVQTQVTTFDSELENIINVKSHQKKNCKPDKEVQQLGVVHEMLNKLVDSDMAYKQTTTEMLQLITSLLDNKNLLKHQSLPQDDELAQNDITIKKLKDNIKLLESNIKLPESVQINVAPVVFKIVNFTEKMKTNKEW